jgi:NADH-quinone oxidoreductase subunit L
MFRIYFVVFVAPYKNATKTKTSLKYYKTPLLIIAPLCILAFGSLFAGFINAHFLGTHIIDDWLSYLNPSTGILATNTEFILVLISIIVALFGVAIAYVKYASWDINTKESTDGIVGNRFYIDEFYHMVIVNTHKKLSLLISNKIEKIVDKIIMFIPNLLVCLSRPSSKLFQNANLRTYVGFVLIGIFAIFIYMYIKLFGVSL